MKKENKFIIGAFACALMSVSCTKEYQTVLNPETAYGTISVQVTPDRVVETKALDAYTGVQAYESAINRIQLLVFNSSGALDHYVDLGSSSMTATISTSVGQKTIYAVVNGSDLSGVETQSALENTLVGLSENSTDAAVGFVMAGSSACSVTASSTASCRVNVSRLTARVVLKSVTNNLPPSYGTVTIPYVFLANVVGEQKIAGSTSLASVTWYNKYGRSDNATSASHIIGSSSSYEASCKSLTYAQLGASLANGNAYAPSAPHLLYTCANSSTAAPSVFSTGSFNPQRTILVVAAEIKGSLYYYPVVLDKSAIERNTTYTVALTLSGLGSSDPVAPVEHGSISASISVSAWAAGVSYEESI